jgi:hypothetical protein
MPLGPTQAPIQRKIGSNSPELKLPEREADRYYLSCAEV